MAQDALPEPRREKGAGILKETGSRGFGGVGVGAVTIIALLVGLAQIELPRVPSRRRDAVACSNR